VASIRKIEANRRNAKRSTGPTTEAGKAIVGQNHRTHGLHSGVPVPGSEDAAGYNAVLAAYEARFQPANALESALVRQAASAEWRLRRIVRIETGMFAGLIERERKRTGRPDTRPDNRTKEEQAYDNETKRMGMLFHEYANGDAFGKLLRYENHIRRGHTMAIERLQALQQRPPKVCFDSSKPTSPNAVNAKPAPQPAPGPRLVPSPTRTAQKPAATSSKYPTLSLDTPCPGSGRPN